MRIWDDMAVQGKIVYKHVSGHLRLTAGLYKMYYMDEFDM